MAIDKVKTCFREYGMEERIQEFDVSSATANSSSDSIFAFLPNFALYLGLSIFASPAVTISTASYLTFSYPAGGTRKHKEYYYLCDRL